MTGSLDPDDISGTDGTEPGTDTSDANYDLSSRVPAGLIPDLGAAKGYLSGEEPYGGDGDQKEYGRREFGKTTVEAALATLGIGYGAAEATDCDGWAVDLSRGKCKPAGGGAVNQTSTPTTVATTTTPAYTTTTTASTPTSTATPATTTTPAPTTTEVQRDIVMLPKPLRDEDDQNGVAVQVYEEELDNFDFWFEYENESEYDNLHTASRESEGKLKWYLQSDGDLWGVVEAEKIAKEFDAEIFPGDQYYSGEHPLADWYDDLTNGG